MRRLRVRNPLDNPRPGPNRRRHTRQNADGHTDRARGRRRSAGSTAGRWVGGEPANADPGAALPGGQSGLPAGAVPIDRQERPDCALLPDVLPDVLLQAQPNHVRRHDQNHRRRGQSGAGAAKALGR
uniref:(northern house mosquito) hypothetical protein n=1 Tax=Culex pipiens TaxID=7175 RepID=A0A8D8C6V1_CULPI